MTKTIIETPNPQDEKLHALQELFPEAFREGKLDPTLLSASLGDAVSNEKEAYGMTWAGKADARRQILTPTSHTLTGDEDASVKWDTTQNILIEGDNLTVLKLLQKGYTKKVKMVYIDPPYNTGKDFVYHDNFHTDKANYETTTGQRDSEGAKLVQNTETNGRYHSDWLSMMYPRLYLARNILRDDGVIFVSIDDHEVHNLRKIMDEVFGEENFVGIILWKKKTNGNNMGLIPPVHDYILVYGKSVLHINEGDFGIPITPEYITKNYSNPDNDPRGLWTTSDLSANHRGPTFPIINPVNKDIHHPAEGRYWVFNENEVLKRINDGRIIFGKSGNVKPVQKVFLADREKSRIISESWWDKIALNEDATEELKELFNVSKIMDHPKPTKLLKHIVNISTNIDDLIIDFFAGSGTTGHAVMALNAEEKAEAVKNETNPDEVGNRRYICVQLPEATDEKSEAFKAGYTKISDITAERLRRAGTKIAEANPTLTLDTGFRFYRLDESCYQIAQVQYDSDNEQSTLESFEKALASGLSPLREGVTEADVITENLLKEGFPLNTALSEIMLGKTAFLHAETEGKRLFITFTDSIPLEMIDEVQKGYKEAIFVVYDSALTDSLKVMLASRVTLRTI